MKMFFNSSVKPVNPQFMGSMFVRIASSTNCSSCSGAK